MSMLAPFSFPTVTYGIAIPSPCYRVLTDKFVNRENGTTLSCSGALSRKGTKPVAPFRRSKLRSGSRSQHHDVRRKRCALRAGAQSLFFCSHIKREHIRENGIHRCADILNRRMREIGSRLQRRIPPLQKFYGLFRIRSFHRNAPSASCFSYSY